MDILGHSQAARRPIESPAGIRRLNGPLGLTAAAAVAAWHDHRRGEPDIGCRRVTAPAA